MEITFAPRDILQIDDARIVYRNFSGTGSKFNREGDRNFAVVIPDQDVVDELVNRGWNVKIKPPRDEDDTPFMFLPVKIKFNERGPKVYLQTRWSSSTKRVSIVSTMSIFSASIWISVRMIGKSTENKDVLHICNRFMSFKKSTDLLRECSEQNNQVYRGSPLIWWPPF